MNAKISPELAAAITDAERRGSGIIISAIVTFTGRPDPGALEGAGFQVERAFASIAAVSGRGAPASLRAVAALPEVARVEMDGEAQALPSPRTPG